MPSFKKFSIILSLVVMLFLNGCIAMSSYEGPKDFFDGSVITTSVKSRLISTNKFDSFQISVSTLNGDILLSGFVANERQKALAEQVANNTQGVKKVINNIVVIP